MRYLDTEVPSATRHPCFKMFCRRHPLVPFATPYASGEYVTHGWIYKGAFQKDGVSSSVPLIGSIPFCCQPETRSFGSCAVFRTRPASSPHSSIAPLFPPLPHGFASASAPSSFPSRNLPLFCRKIGAGLPYDSRPSLPAPVSSRSSFLIPLVVLPNLKFLLTTLLDERICRRSPSPSPLFPPIPVLPIPVLLLLPRSQHGLPRADRQGSPASSPLFPFAYPWT